MKILIVISFLVPQLLFAKKPTTDSNEGWKFSATKDGITVYIRSNKSNGIHAFKVMSTLKAPAKKILALMRDVEHTHEWSPDVKESKTITNYSDLKAITYSALGVPWPISNRDFVLSNELNLDEKNKYMILNIQSVETKNKPPRKSFVRAYMKGKIYLRPVSATETAMVMFADIDPKGSIPKWIVNLFQKGWPYKYFQSIEKNANARNSKLNAGLEKMLNKLNVIIAKSPKSLLPLNEVIAEAEPKIITAY